METSQKQTLLQKPNTQSPMTLGTLIDSMISVVDLNTNEASHIQIPNSKLCVNPASSNSLINAILNKPNIELLKQQEFDENGGGSTPKKMKLTSPSPARSPSIQQQFLNEDDRGRKSSITKNILKDMTLDDMDRLNRMHENAILKQQKGGQMIITPSTTPVTSTTLTPSPSPNGHVSARVISPTGQDTHAIDPIIPRNRKNSMTWKILNEEEQNLNNMNKGNNKQITNNEYAELLKQQQQNKQSVELSSKESFGNILNTIIDKEIKEPNDFMIPTASHYSAFSALQHATNGGITKSTDNADNHKEHHHRRHHDRNHGHSSGHHRQHRTNEVIDIDSDDRQKVMKDERAMLLSEARSYGLSGIPKQTQQPLSSSTAAASLQAAQAQQLFLQQQQQQQQQHARLFNHLSNNQFLQYQNELGALNPQLFNNLISRFPNNNLMLPTNPSLLKLQQEVEEQQQLQRHDMLLKQQQRLQQVPPFNPQLNSPRSLNHRQSPSPPPTGSIFPTRSPLNIPPLLLEQLHAAQQQQQSNQNNLLSAVQSPYHGQRNLAYMPHLFPQHGSSQASHQPHIDPSLLHLLNSNEFKKNPQLLNPHHGLLLPQLNLGSINPALAVIENSGHHRNMPSQTSIRTGTVSSHSNEPESNKLKQSNSSNQLSHKQQQIQHQYQQHQLQAQLQQHQLHAQLQQQQQPGYFKKRILSSFESPSPGALKSSSSSSQIKNLSHNPMKLTTGSAATPYELLSDSEDS